MIQYRENRIRGTEDFPFDYYDNHLKNSMIEPHWHPEIEMLHIEEGQLTANVSEEKYVLNPGDIFFINPEELHTLVPYTSEVKYKAAVFEASLFQFKGTHFLEQDFTMPIINGDLKFPRVVGREHWLYDRIHPVVYRIFYEDPGSKPLIFADLTALFCMLLNDSLLVKAVGDGTYRRLEDVKLCIKYMEENFAQKITLAELASLVSMSSNYFCSYFKKYTGVSPFTQLNYIRIKEAAKMLLKSDESVVRVATDCGFENVSFFIRKFKEIMGCTPSVYRNKT